jgi:hypothetical protein
MNTCLCITYVKDHNYRPTVSYLPFHRNRNENVNQTPAKRKPLECKGTLLAFFFMDENYNYEGDVPIQIPVKEALSRGGEG